MKTEHLQVDPRHPHPRSIAHAAALLRAGGLVAFPTETVYGLGANALDAAAVERIFAAKGRPAHDPLIVHLAGAEGLRRVAASVPLGARALVEHFWPGPLTLVLPRHPSLPANVTAGGPTVAVRVPQHAIALALLAAAAVPIAAPSANLFSHTSPTTAAHVLADLDGRIDLVLDGGPTPIGLESTVLDVTGLDDGRPARILRPGGVTFEAIADILGADRVRDRVRDPGHDPGHDPVHDRVHDRMHEPVAVEPTDEEGSSVHTPPAPLASPGLLDRHYAPRTPLTLFVGEAEATRHALRSAALHSCLAGDGAVILLYDEDRPLLDELPPAGCRSVALGSLADVDGIAHRLYGALREADGMGAGLLLAREAPGGGLAAALRDRMRRAADRVVDSTSR